MAAWHELFPLDREPTMEDIAGYIDHPLWDAFTAFIDESYGAKPRIEYSRCGGAPGWNVKYKARGRALCTVYPRDGFFICMVSVGSKEKDEAEALLATADPYVRALYERSADSSMAHDGSNERGHIARRRGAHALARRPERSALMMRDPEQTIGNLIDRRNTSFVGSVDEDGYPEVKAMLPPRKREGIRTFYFTSNTSSMRAAHYRAHTQTCIYFVDRRFFRGVMLKGTMEVLEDAWAKELIWLDGDETYYPLGVTDPDYCVLRFTAERGRYYQNFSSEDFAVPAV